jgi:hypothetical protein
MPTEEEHRAASARWLKHIGPCLWENWPEALKALSFRTELLELTSEDQQAIWAIMDGKGVPKALEEKLDQRIREFGPCFIKLSSRSPKDWWPDEGPPACTSGAEVLGSLGGSMRIADDLIEYQYAETPCYLLLREHHVIPKHEEWRCFIREGKIAGITQYHYRDFFPEMVREQIEARCRGFLQTAVMPVLHLDTVVVDVWLREEPLVIEINPYGLSDPCLFSYPELQEADGELRVVEGV